MFFLVKKNNFQKFREILRCGCLLPAQKNKQKMTIKLLQPICFFNHAKAHKCNYIGDTKERHIIQCGNAYSYKQRNKNHNFWETREGEKLSHATVGKKRKTKGGVVPLKYHELPLQNLGSLAHSERGASSNDGYVARRFIRKKLFGKNGQENLE